MPSSQLVGARLELNTPCGKHGACQEDTAKAIFQGSEVWGQFEGQGVAPTLGATTCFLVTSGQVRSHQAPEVGLLSCIATHHLPCDFPIARLCTFPAISGSTFPKIALC